MKGARYLKEPPLPASPEEIENLFGTPEDHAPTICELGTVGWKGDDETVDSGGTENSNVSYVKVTLHAGSPAGEPEDDEGGANGYQLRCRMLRGFRIVPVKGAPCFVLFPGGKVAEGLGLCLPLEGPSPLQLPNDQIGASMLYGESGAFFKVHKSGALSQMTTHDGTTDGRTIALLLRPQNPNNKLEGGLEFHCPWGRFEIGPAGIFLEHASGGSIAITPIAGIPDPFGALGSQVQVSADAMDLSASAMSFGTDSGAASFATLQALNALVDQLAIAIVAGAAVSGATATFANAAAVGTAAAAWAAIKDNLAKVV